MPGEALQAGLELQARALEVTPVEERDALVEEGAPARLDGLCRGVLAERGCHMRHSRGKAEHYDPGRRRLCRGWDAGWLPPPRFCCVPMAD